MVLDHFSSHAACSGYVRKKDCAWVKYDKIEEGHMC